MMNRLSLYTLLFLSLSGCIVSLSERGTKKILDDSVLSETRIGETTKASVMNRLGAPRTKEQESTTDGVREVWTYTYFKQGSYELIPALREKLSKPQIHRSLEVTFDQAGKVKSVKRSASDIKEPDVLIFP